MRRPFTVITSLLLIGAGVAIGVAAYNAGYNRGLEANGTVEVIRTVGPGWGFFPGFFIFPLIVLAIFAFGRGFRHGGSHHGGWSYHGNGHDVGARSEERSAEWHRRQHEREGDRTPTQ